VGGKRRESREGVMQTIRNDPATASDNRLRFVLSASDKDTIVSVGIAADATFEDVARTMSKYPRWRYGRPVSIRVVFEPAPRAAPLH
jgi:hypothetical protein